MNSCWLVSSNHSKIHIITTMFEQEPTSTSMVYHFASHLITWAQLQVVFVNLKASTSAMVASASVASTSITSFFVASLASLRLMHLHLLQLLLTRPWLLQLHLSRILLSLGLPCNLSKYCNLAACNRSLSVSWMQELILLPSSTLSNLAQLMATGDSGNFRTSWMGPLTHALRLAFFFAAVMVLFVANVSLLQQHPLTFGVSVPLIPGHTTLQVCSSKSLLRQPGLLLFITLCRT